MLPQNDTTELELRDYLVVLRRRKWTVIGATVLVVAATLLVSFLQTPVYQASATVLVQARSSASVVGVGNDATNTGRDNAAALANDVELIRSQVVRQAVAEKLGGPATVSVSTVGDAAAIKFTAESTDPEEAATIANTYAETYIEIRRKNAIDDYLATAGVIQERVNELQVQINDLASQGADIAQIQPLISQQELYKGQLDQLQVAADLIATGGARVITEATPPSSPVRPTPERNAVVALVVGLIFGVGLAFLFEYLDDTIKSKDDLERATGGVPTLGIIPSVAGWKDRETPQVVTVLEPRGQAAETYRLLRTSVQFLGLERPIRTLQITSARAGEGKTTTVANLAVALSRAGQRVAMVDCDLRRPRVHEFFGLANDTGFTTVLLGDTPLSSALLEVPGEDRLLLLPSGATPPNPSELLSTRRTAEVLEGLTGMADVVLIDSPPLLPVTDGLVLSASVDATLLVVTAGRTTKKQAHRAVELLRQVDAPLIGSVLNGVTSQLGDAYGYGYGYGYRYGYGYGSAYGPAEGKKRRRRGRRSAETAAEPSVQPLPVEPPVDQRA
ncbi:MAG: polysaccharide biosynthesis tyrosine autokinase [Acidimicrobiales bacterium]|nr:polysaccharide biosynthesis tyrosine autokinase [Acidimicrobiales bacterium]